ncbi:MAG: hypothetical protein EPO07_07600 [Verrucomicrobia bacterium]|nr:MAG: hypothetical protein EPO07_07600 [Verrucomicrobiota bacterium]
MKTKSLRIWTMVGVSAVVIASGPAVKADQATPPTGTTTTASTAAIGKHYTGTIVSIDPKENALVVRGSVFGSKKFALGEGCSFLTLDKSAAAGSDLRAGQKVLVVYQNVQGVNAANHVEQLPMRSEGFVKSIDAAKGTLTLHQRASNKEFRIPEGCKVVLRNSKSGELADIKPGHFVTVTYESPGGLATVFQIAQTSAEFNGTLTAIDLTDRTVKAKAAFGTKKFNLADNCAIVVNGRTDGQMRDLKPGDRFVFNYDEVNGVNVVNRIANSTMPEVADTAQTGRR